MRQWLSNLRLWLVRVAAVGGAKKDFYDTLINFLCVVKATRFWADVFVVEKCVFPI